MVLGLLLCLVALLETAKVRIFAFEAHIEGAFVHRIFFKFVVVSICWVSKLFVLVQAFNFGAIDSHFFYFVFDLGAFLDQLMNVRVVLSSHSYFACRTLEKFKDYAWGRPLITNQLPEALVVERVLTRREHHAGLC